MSTVPLDDVIFETLVADHPRALQEWGKRTENDVEQYRQPERAAIYADGIMNTSFGASHGVGLRAAHSDFAPEYPPIQRTPLQERLRVRIAKFVEPTFRSNQQARADAYARARVDRLEHWMCWNAVVEAVQARVGAAVPEAERAAHAEEARYEAGRRRW
jgi:hypothetical protein